jgi:nucleoside phosphorylase
VAILTALPVEFAAVQSFLENVEEIIHPNGTVYSAGDFRAVGVVRRIVLAEIGMGNPIAGIETVRMLAYVQPRLALFVGLAGGAKDVQIGDVVAAEYVYGYEPSKIADTVQPRIKTLVSAYALVQRARAVRRGDLWHKRIATGAKPRGFVGAIASGEQVVASDKAETFAMLKHQCGDALAVEMEGWGFLHAAHTSGDIPAIVIRGISDLIDGKDPEHDIGSQPAAAAHAAAFAFELLATLDNGQRRDKTGSLPLIGER